MSRQTFTKGQTVYCHRWSDHYKKAIVTSPDLMKRGLTNRKTHYVGVRYINHEGQPEGSEWPITNRSNLIITEEAFDKIEKAKIIANLHGDMRAYETFEQEFRPYFKQAEIISRTLFNTVGEASVEPADIRELAHYLRGMFGFTITRRQLTRAGVRALRKARRTTAARARDELTAMGEEPPELAEEAGA